MENRFVGENFKIIISTKKTLFGADSSNFKIYYANVNSLKDKVAIEAQVTEAITPITAGKEHSATTSGIANAGSKVLTVNSGHTFVGGDTLSYGSGLFAYVAKVTSTKIYLKTGITQSIPNGTNLVQVGNTGEYVTGDLSIPQAGEYLVTIEAAGLGILAEQRVKVNDVVSTTPVYDPEAPQEIIAVAY